MKLIHRIYKLLNQFQKKQVGLILILILIGLFFEMLSIGIIFPIFEFALHPEKVKKIQIFLNLNQEISQKTFLKYSMIFIFFIYLIKTIFLYFSIKRQNIFATNVIKDLSQELFHGYIEMPYLFHVNNNSSRLIRNVTVETGAFLAFLQSAMILISESAIVFSVLVLMFFVEFKGTLFTILFFTISSFIFNSATKRIMERLGKDRQYHDGEYSKHLLQGLNGIKDIKILGKEIFFVKQFDYHNRKRTEILIKNNTIQQVPRLYLEFISIFALSMLVIYFVYTSQDISSILPILGLYAASSFRLIPSLNRILVSLSTIKYHKSAIDEIENELSFLRENIKFKDNNYNSFSDFNEMIELRNVTFSYDDKKHKILDNLNLVIKSGDTVGFIGESGAGKSTLVDIIIGLLSPINGEYFIDHKPLEFNGKSLNKLIGYVPQSIFFIDDTLEKNIAFGVEDKYVDKEKLKQSIINSQLESFVNNLPEGLQTRIGERGVKISGGQRQRIGIARALYFSPKILVFDEATSALDNETETAVMDTVNQLKGKITIILIAHRLSTLKNCDKIYKIIKGKANLIQI